MSDKEENYAEQVLLQQVWMMINEEHGEVLMSNNLQQRIESAFKDYKQSYADQEKKEYLKDVLEEVEKEIENNFPINSGMSNRTQEQFMDEKRVAEWLLNHIKQRKR